MKNLKIPLTVHEMKTLVSHTESVLSLYVGEKVEKLRKMSGDRMANEMVMSVAALLAARSIGMTHVWTGESIDTIRKRFVDTMDADLQPTLKKIVAAFAKQEEKARGR